MPKWVKQFRLFLWLILATFLLWLIWQALVPNGQISYSYDFSKPNDFIGALTPLDRVEEPDQNSQKIIGNPVYFSLRTARPFDEAKLSITYKNPSALANIEAGVLVDHKLWRYDLQPVANKLIDAAIASGTWGLVENGQTLLLQKTEKYNSIADFLVKLPPRNELALYNYQLADNYQLPNYQATSTVLVWNYPLKGDYQFYTYLKKENLSIDFTFSDLNENKDTDPVEVSVYNSIGQIVATETLADDGATAQVTAPRSLNLSKSNLPEGVYKIEVKANSDIITERISAKLSKLAFVNRLWLAASPKALSLYAKGGRLSLQTINPASRSSAYVGQELIDLSETYRQIFSESDCGELCQIKLTKGDIILAGDAVFALSASSLIEPRSTKLASRTTIPANIKYILANYSQPEPLGDWQKSEIKVDLTKAYREQGKYSFMLSVPSLSAEDDIKDYLEIKNISVELKGKSWQVLLAKLLGK